MSPSVIAVDLGATSGRVVLTSFEDGRLALTEVHRFPTAATRTDAGLQLDVDALYAHIQDGIAGAMKLAGGEVAAVGIDCWAVDYGLLGDHGPLGRPFNYRDERTAVGKAEVERLIDAAELYSRVGIQDNAINTVNQLVEDRLAGRLDDARLFLLLPDLIGHRLTGRAVAERTNASTTSLLDPVDGDWDWELIDRLGLPRHIFPELIEPGTVVGTIIDGPAAGIELVAVGSHDTASAVVGAPLTGPDDVFISSGTWSLIGMELDAPILTEASRRANLTNEAGVDGTVRYLKNVMGMWLLSEAGRAWAEAGREVSIPSLVVEAEGVENALRFDATDPTLLHPGDMPARLTALVGGDARMDDPAFLARTVLESLADAYAATVAELARITGRRPERIVIVGGGANNALLSQLTADRTGLPVTAGPVEATAIGNSLIQARATGLVSGTLTDLRRIVMTSSETTSYSPDPRAVLAALSNEFGADPAFVRAGGGNSSVKLDGVLWIKPSGVSMATLAADDLVPLDLDLLNGSLDAPDPDPALGDPVNHIAGLARRDDGPRRPSVEILFHALIPDTYVVHTHPLLINAVTCNTVGRELTRDLFGDEVLWVEYVDPGLPLARLVKQRREEFTQRTGQEPPAATFLMNHGLIVSGEDPNRIRAISHDIMARIEAAVADDSRAVDTLATLAAAFKAAVGAEHVALDAGQIASGFPTTEAGSRFLTDGPLIPDQIVYAGSFPVVLHPGEPVADAVEAFRRDHGNDPVIAVVPGLGVVGSGDSACSAKTALEVYVDALTVGVAATRLGSVRALDERERSFIETWEAEAYRKQVAKN